MRTEIIVRRYSDATLGYHLQGQTGCFPIRHWFIRLPSGMRHWFISAEKACQSDYWGHAPIKRLRNGAYY